MWNNSIFRIRYKLIIKTMWKLNRLGLLLFCFLFIGNALASASGDQDDKINQTIEGKKQGKWIIYGKDRPESGIPSTGKVEEGKYVDDRKEGIWIKYHDDGVTPKLKGEYENNRPKGIYTKYWPNGKVRETGTFEKNQQLDSLVRFYETGVREYVADYNELGKEQGKVKFYYPNGQEELVYTANNGTPTGTATRYWPNGDVKEIITYSSTGEITNTIQKEMVSAPEKVKDPGTPGKQPPKINGTPKTPGATWKPNGYNKVYNEDGEISQDGTFKDGRLWDGKVYVYDKDGILLKVEVYKSGSYHSDGQL